VTMEKVEGADEAVKQLNKSELDRRILSVEKARRGRARTPTPGKYLGSERSRSDRRERGDHSRPDRSRSDPYDRDRYDRDRYERERDRYERDSRYARDSRYDRFESFDRRDPYYPYDDRYSRGYPERDRYDSYGSSRYSPDPYRRSPDRSRVSSSYRRRSRSPSR